MSEYRVRDYTPSDFDSVNKLWEETGMGGAERGDNEKTIDESVGIGGRLLVLEESAVNRIIGTSWMTYDGRRIHLHHFGITPAYQGRGLSKILLERSLQYIKDKGIQVKVEVHESNRKALNLYLKYGFNYLGDYRVYIIRDTGTIYDYGTT
ncbi:MAG TPA: GNAT family N-acetyltransferase [Bacteroidales bacterium]|nr:GNAT family N-acetyltransferase [Bacteroidales bacterium]